MILVSLVIFMFFFFFFLLGFLSFLVLVIPYLALSSLCFECRYSGGNGAKMNRLNW